MSLTAEQQQKEQEEDEEDIVLAHKYRLSLPSAPRQSSFRVLAVIFYELNNDGNNNINDNSNTNNNSSSSSSINNNSHQRHQRHHVVGANDEPCYINGSICAERAALVQLRFIPNLRRITKVVISTDAQEPVHPGMLCREFMSSHPNIDPEEMRVVLAGSVCRRSSNNGGGHGCGLDISTSAATAKEFSHRLVDACCCSSSSASASGSGEEIHHKYHQWDVVRTNLTTIYPFPSVYTRLTAGQSVQLGTRNKFLLSSFSMKNKSNSNSSSSKWNTISGTNLELIQKAIDAARDRTNDRISLHPIQYGAAVRMSDGTIHTAIQQKALEYGCSVDAVTQFASMFRQKAKESDGNSNGDGDGVGDDMGHSQGIHPVMLVQADNFGLLHPPFATARAFLAEYGHGKCKVLIMAKEEEEEMEDLKLTLKSKSSLLNNNNENNNNENNNIHSGEMAIVEVSVQDLAPFSPNVGDLWKKKDE
mmetsp:Transcript_5383/g.7997  ORF Transcript_5383/g.7997 Transcript_5383/m.7997 type:complete len:475 (-) Transcript_5383:142-1566(-)